MNKKLIYSLLSIIGIIILVLIALIFIMNKDNKLQESKKLSNEEINSINNENEKIEEEIEDISKEIEQLESQKNENTNDLELENKINQLKQKQIDLNNKKIENNNKTETLKNQSNNKQEQNKNQQTNTNSAINKNETSKPQEEEKAPIENVSISNISISTDNRELIIGKSYKIYIETNPKGISVKGKWEVSDSSVVSIDDNGNIKGLKKGNANITFVSDNGIRSNTLTVYSYYDVSLSKTIYNKNGINITAYRYMYGSKGTTEACLYMNFKNNSGKIINAYTTTKPKDDYTNNGGLIINGAAYNRFETQPVIVSKEINGSNQNTYISIKQEALNNRGIEKIKTISFYVVIKNAEDYNDTDITDLVTINL